MNGTMYFTSRYFTFNAESHNPIANAAANATRKNTGNSSKCRCQLTPAHTITPNKITSPMAKSTAPLMTALAGMMRRGK